MASMKLLSFGPIPLLNHSALRNSTGKSSFHVSGDIGAYFVSPNSGCLEEYNNIYEVLQRTLEADGGVGVDDAQLGDVHAPWEAEIVPTSCRLWVLVDALVDCLYK